MSVVHALVLGFVQGISEFLPISSSGHLILLPKLFGWSDQGLTFDVVVHLGSLVAVVVYFRHKLWRMVKSLVVMDKAIKVDLSLSSDRGESPHFYRRLAALLALSIIPAGLFGYFFDGWIETNLRATWVVAFDLIFWGLLLGIADLYQRSATHMHQLTSVTLRDTIIIGFAQALALFPGTSRSGITMTAGLFCKFDKKTAAEFSFLMSVPIIALAGLVKIKDLIQNGLDHVSIFPLTVGFFSAMISGFFAIWVLMKMIERWSFLPFVLYRVVLGVFLLLLF